MANWSKSFETYLKLNERQRLGIGHKSNEILEKEFEKLTEEDILRPTLYLLAIAPFASEEEELSKKEFDFIKQVIGYKDGYDKYLDLVKKGKNEKLAKFFQAYFKKLDGDIFTAYLSLGLAILTIKGEQREEDVELLVKIYEQ